MTQTQNQSGTKKNLLVKVQGHFLRVVFGSHLLSVGVSQNVAPHDVDQVGFWVDFTHEATQSPPEPEQREIIWSQKVNISSLTAGLSQQTRDD